MHTLQYQHALRIIADMELNNPTHGHPRHGAAGVLGSPVVQAARKGPAPGDIQLPIVLSNRALSRLLADIQKN